MRDSDVYVYLEVKVLVDQACVTLSTTWTVCSPPGSSVQGALQEGILEWGTISFSRGSFWPRDGTRVSCTADGFFTMWATRDIYMFSSVQFSHSVVSDYLQPHDCSTPGLPVYHQLPEFTQTHVHWVGDAIQPISPSVIHFSSCPQPFPTSGSFQMS